MKQYAAWQMLFTAPRMIVCPKYLNKGITFEEAKYTLVCRKLFKQQLAIENIPEEVVDTYYKKDAPHDMYIAEVVEILT